jgi:large-conductance mechanosensitive channel
MLIVTITLIAFAVLWLVAITRKATRQDRKQQQDLDKIRHMDSAVLTELLNGKK